jgi:hypothetical protein
MRIARLVPTVGAVALLLGLAPASALARKHPSPNGNCRISINVAPRQITAGDPVVIFGRLACRKQGQAANQTVKLFHHLVGAPGSGFNLVQITTTDANGFYEYSRADGVVDSNRAWYVRAHGAQSARKNIHVAAQVTLAGPPEGTQLLTGAANKVTFTGTVNPADVGARVILQRQNADTGNDWHRIDSAAVVAGGNFSITHRFLVPGDANLRVLVRSQRRNIPSTSNVLEYEVSQAQNPKLTILSSVDPVLYGQSTTISGVVAGAVNQPVTLLAHTRRQVGFAPVAEVNTDANGNYSFPAQSPVNSTFYLVRTRSGACATSPPTAKACVGPVVNSAVLYEAVKDVLTAQVSATTVQAGTQLTFSGTVAPSHPGHVIYLQRQDASGQGFHVVEVATVNADSTYSIAHTVYDAGTKVFRVFIPGGPENAGAASAPLQIQVTPAPAPALTPESPSNSTLPPAGN